MTETQSNNCTLCGKPYDPSAFNVEDRQYYAGRKVRLVQGMRTLTGARAEIVSGKPPTFSPGLYEVRLESNGRVLRVRWDHMMFEDVIETDPHYRELYMHRLEACLYEYPETKF